MRIFGKVGCILAVCGLTDAGALAQTPVERYLAARDRMIATIEQEVEANGTGGIGGRQAGALLDLQAMLAPIVGPVAMPGFASRGTITLDTLIREEGYGKLDGLVFAGTAGDARAVVTTQAILVAWLKEHGPQGRDDPGLPQTIDRALRSEDFYSEALADGSRFAKFAELSVPPSANAEVRFAMLAAQRQDIGLQLPDRIVVAVMRGTRLFLLTAPVRAKVAPIAICEDVFRRYERRAAAALRSYRTSGQRDQGYFDEYVRLGTEGDVAYRTCFSKHFQDQPASAAVAKQAGTLVQAVLQAR